jgi:hypothetical protein
MRAALVLGAAALLAVVTACGHAGKAPDAAPASQESTACQPPEPASTPRTDGTVQQADNGHSVCLRTGQRLAVILGTAGSTGSTWSTVRSSDTALLQPVTNTSATLPRGLTAGFFRAAGPGTADLTSDNSGIPWRVHIVVR